jgi:hypothetical protein
VVKVSPLQEEISPILLLIRTKLTLALADRTQAALYTVKNHLMD